jgi:hypothetical protein
MSIRIYRPLAASALLAGSLCLLAATAEAAPVPRPARPVATAPASVFGSLLDTTWSRLVHLFAGDHGDAGTNDHHGGHSGGGPDNDEGPGMCPHGH